VKSRATRKQSPSRSQMSDSVATDMSYQKDLEDPFESFYEMMNGLYAKEG